MNGKEKVKKLETKLEYIEGVLDDDKGYSSDWQKLNDIRRIVQDKLEDI